jgi:hypothetical protein
MLVGCISFAGDQIGCVSCLRTRLLWLPPRVTFFLISETHVVIVRYVFSFWHHSLSLRRRPLLFRQQHSLSLSSEGHSFDLCAQMSPPTCPIHRRHLRALWGSRLISLLKKLTLQQAGRPRSWRRKRPVDVDCAVLRVVAAAATPPPILLLAAALAS